MSHEVQRNGGMHTQTATHGMPVEAIYDAFAGKQENPFDKDTLNVKASRQKGFGSEVLTPSDDVTVLASGSDPDLAAVLDKVSVWSDQFEAQANDVEKVQTVETPRDSKPLAKAKANKPAQDTDHLEAKWAKNPTTTQLDAQALQAKRDIEWVLIAHNDAIILIASATLDKLGYLLCAHAHVSQTAGGALSRYSGAQREWSHIEAVKIKNTHGGVSHAITIAAGVGQLTWSMVCMAQLAQLGAIDAGSVALKQAQMTAIDMRQKTGTQVGTLGQSVGGWRQSINEGERMLSQSHQGILSTDRQQSGQDSSQVKQTSQQSVDKAGQIAQAQDAAFREVARGG